MIGSWLITDQELDLERGHVVSAGAGGGVRRVVNGRRRRRGGRGADGQLSLPPLKLPAPEDAPGGTGYPRRAALDARGAKRSAGGRGRGAARRGRGGHGHGERTDGNVSASERTCGAACRAKAGEGNGYSERGWEELALAAGITASERERFPWRS
jgi:hypothetical protein